MDLSTTSGNSELTLNLCVPFPTPREAEIVFDVLRVDAEPKRAGVSKALSVEQSNLCVTFTASEARHLRTGVNSFFEHLILATETIAQFGPPESDKYEHTQRQ